MAGQGSTVRPSARTGARSRFAGHMPVRLRVGRALLLCVGLLVPLVGAPDAARAERLLDLIPFGRAHRLSRVLPAVVNISMTKMKTDAPAPGQTTPPEPHLTQFYGSGFIVDASGIIVTNRHVVDGRAAGRGHLAERLDLAGPDHRHGHHHRHRAAQGRLRQAAADGPLGDSDKVRVGDWVFAIGNPLGVGQTVTSGIVSALNRDILISPYDDFIQTDAAINHGNSGGPLFDSRGEVIGVNTAIFSPTETGGSIGIGFAIPARDVQFAIDRLRRFGQLRPGWIGLRTQDVTSEIAEAIGLAPARGVIVAGTEPKSPAAASGLAEGDVVLRFDGQVPKDNRALARMIAEAPTGQPASLTVWRDGRERTFR